VDLLGFVFVEPVAGDGMGTGQDLGDASGAGLVAVGYRLGIAGSSKNANPKSAVCNSEL
jgi:hypothetical protein